MKGGDRQRGGNFVIKLKEDLLQYIYWEKINKVYNQYTFININNRKNSWCLNYLENNCSQKIVITLKKTQVYNGLSFKKV